VKKLQELVLLAYSPYKDVLTETAWERMQTNISDTGAFVTLVERANCFVCRDSHQLLGMILLIPSGNPTDTFRADWSYLRLLSVRPGYEGRGIGKRLTEMCIHYAAYSGEKTLALHTSEFQHAARHIYEHMGFERTDEFRHLGKKYWIYLLNLQEYHPNGTDKILSGNGK
jgi:GNAT superfamily N-acetyltransferase